MGSLVDEDFSDTADSRGMSKTSLRATISRFTENNNQENDFKDEEYVRRRIKKRDNDRRIKSQQRIKMFRRIYIPAVLFISGGVIATLACSVQSIGEGTFFWNLKEEFRIAGPIILVVGLILLLIGVGLTNEEYLRLKQEDRKEQEQEQAAELQKKEFDGLCKCKCADNSPPKIQPNVLNNNSTNSCDTTSLRPLLSRESSQSSNCTVSEIQRLNKNERVKQLPIIHIQTERQRRFKLDSEGSSDCETYESSLLSASTEMTSLYSPSRSSYFDFSGKKNASRQNSSDSRQHIETTFISNQTSTAMLGNRESDINSVEL